MRRDPDIYDCDGFGGNWPTDHRAGAFDRLTVLTIGMTVAAAIVGLWCAMPTLCRWAAAIRQAI